MSDERRGEGGGAAVAAVVIVVILLFVGLLVVGGGFALFAVRSSQMARVAEMEARMQAERARAEMMAAEAALTQLNARQDKATFAPGTSAAPDASEVKPAEPAGPELLLKINAAGEFKLGEKMLSFEELKDVLLTEHNEKGPNLVLAIVAEPETPFKRVNQAIEAAECASINKMRIRNTPLEPAANK